MKIKFILILIISNVCLNSFSQSETAIQFYDQKKYQEAISEWNKLITDGAKGEELYYNIGNTYYRLQQYPEAILFYNKALKWNPNCDDCKKNLKVVQKAAGIESFELPEFILSKLYHSALISLQPMNWFIAGILLLSIFLYVFLFKINSGLMVRFKPAIYFIMTIGLFCFFLSWQRDLIKHNTDEVILMKASKLYLSPDSNSESKQELIPGQQLIIKDHLSSWIKVQTKEFDLGWVEENKVEVVAL